MNSPIKTELASDYDQAVSRLAALAGIAVDWTDAYGQPQTVSPASLRTILATLGLPCDSQRQAGESMARLQQSQRATDLPPLLTAEVGLDIVLPPHCGLHGQSGLITLEAGRTLPCKVSDDAGAPVLAAIAEHGYHRLQVGAFDVVLAVAPAHCYGVADAFLDQGQAESRGWGLALQLYGLRSAGDGGVGNFGGLARFAAAAGAQGASALAISPVHAMFAADAHRYSPYSPSSRLFLNVMHIDPAAVLGPAALQQVLNEAGPETVALQQRLQQAEQIDWPQAGAHRMALLRRLHAMFRMQPTPSAEFAAFRLQGGQALADHALFEALHQSLLNQQQDIASDWRTWPQRWHQADGAAARSFAEQHSGEIDFHLFLQWQAARGLQAAQQAARASGMAIGLIADLAVGADNGGSQAWSHSTEMISGLAVGAPPDLLNTRGQNWGIGAFSPLAMREQGYRSYIAMLRSVFAHAGGVRIDHVMGLTRLWLTPAGADANDGAYLRYPARDLLRLIALESWRHRAIVIGEDLGTVPPGFDTQLQQAGLMGIGVLWFERGSASEAESEAGFEADSEPAPPSFLPPQQWPAHAIATTSTHDLPSVAGWWRGRDIAWRAQLDLLTPGVTAADANAERVGDRRRLWQALLAADCVSGAQPAEDAPDAVVDGATAYIARTPAPLALLPVEDLLGLEQQPNLPGTIAVHPNWQRRLPQAEGADGDSADLLLLPQARRRMRLLQRS